MKRRAKIVCTLGPATASYEGVRALVYAGMDWVDPQLARRSMQLMAEEVMPRVNAAIAKPSGLRQRTGSAP